MGCRGERGRGRGEGEVASSQAHNATSFYVRAEPAGRKLSACSRDPNNHFLTTRREGQQERGGRRKQNMKKRTSSDSWSYVTKYKMICCGLNVVWSLFPLTIHSIGTRSETQGLSEANEKKSDAQGPGEEEKMPSAWHR